jgi:TIR domain
MAFKYACFISYCHGQYDLVKSFLDQLKAALKAELEPLLDEEVYIDEERLKPGYKYNEELAAAICQSICMVVVYSPRYERHEYCVREFEGMLQLEEKRLKAMGAAGAGRGFIIPIVLRGDDDVPDRIKKYQHYSNFSRFTLAAPDILRNPEYAAEIRKIAAVIYEQYKVFDAIGADPCATCSDFHLPPASGLAPWRPKFVNR